MGFTIKDNKEPLPVLEGLRRERIKDGLKLEYAVLWRIIVILIVYCSVQLYRPFTDTAYREKSLMSLSSYVT